MTTSLNKRNHCGTGGADTRFRGQLPDARQQIYLPHCPYMAIFHSHFGVHIKARAGCNTYVICGWWPHKIGEFSFWWISLPSSIVSGPGEWSEKRRGGGVPVIYPNWPYWNRYASCGSLFSANFRLLTELETIEHQSSFTATIGKLVVISTYPDEASDTARDWPRFIGFCNFVGSLKRPYIVGVRWRARIKNKLYTALLIGGLKSNALKV